MKLTYVQISSGFANIADDFTFADKYYAKNVQDRPGSAYDKVFEVEIPDAKMATTEYGERFVYVGGKCFDSVCRVNGKTVLYSSEYGNHDKLWI